MKFRKLPIAEGLDGDSPAMKHAIDELLQADVDVRRPPNTPYQLKVSELVSYYPAKGTIFVDGEQGARPERGLDALLDLLIDRGELIPLRVRANRI